MSVIDTQYRTISCNSCKNTVTFEVEENKKNPNPTMNENPWLATTRLVQGGGKNYVYCSDECEVEGVTAGNHNPPEEKKIIDISKVGANAVNAIKMAAEKAARDEQATKDIKDGNPVTLG
jgi:hypothetical protein